MWCRVRGAGEGLEAYRWILPSMMDGLVELELTNDCARREWQWLRRKLGEMVA